MTIQCRHATVWGRLKPDVQPFTYPLPLQERAEEALALASAAATERAELHTELAAARQALSDTQAAADARVQVPPRATPCASCISGSTRGTRLCLISCLFAVLSHAAKPCLPLLLIAVRRHTES